MPTPGIVFPSFLTQEFCRTSSRIRQRREIFDGSDVKFLDRLEEIPFPLDCDTSCRIDRLDGRGDIKPSAQEFIHALRRRRRMRDYVGVMHRQMGDVRLFGKPGLEPHQVQPERANDFAAGRRGLPERASIFFL